MRAPRRDRRRGAMNALPDAAHQDEGELAALDLLVLRDQVHQRVGVRHAAGDVCECGSAGRPRRDGAIARRRSACGSRPSRAENSNAQRHAERDRLAVQQPVGEARRGLERVAEGMAEIEQRALAGLALVARDDRRPCMRQLRSRSRARAPARRRTRPASWLRARRRTPHRRAGRIWRPRHSRRGTRAPAACRAARCRRSPGSADGTRRQVLAVARIDAGLAADRGIDLRQQRRRHLHEIEAAPHASRPRSRRDRRPRRRRARRRDRRARSAPRSARRRRARTTAKLFEPSPGGDDDVRRGDAGGRQRRLGCARDSAARQSRR